MAHECFHCGGECYCNGDMDDCVVSLTPVSCEGCGCEDESINSGAARRFDEWDDEWDDDSEFLENTSNM